VPTAGRGNDLGTDLWVSWHATSSSFQCRNRQVMTQDIVDELGYEFDVVSSVVAVDLSQ